LVVKGLICFVYYFYYVCIFPVIQSSSNESLLGGGGDTATAVLSAVSDETLVGVSPTQDSQMTTGRKATGMYLIMCLISS